MNLSEFLKSKGIGAVSVETFTKDDVLDQLRTKTFKVTVRPEQYEDALKPDVWPLRVAVRHFRPPRRNRETSLKDQSSGSEGRVDSTQCRQTNDRNSNSAV